ncbi:MAG: hypothetical protein HYW23_01745 [Candidatus Aenigmarchaeota archaeon]|nr:hypothetical protein [Candidatus Aenigmarchaeota archaeon]
MRLDDLNIRQVLTSDLQRTVEVEIKTKNGISYSSAPVYKNGIYRMRCLPAEDSVRKFLEIKRHFLNQSFMDIQDVDDFLHDIDISVDFREIGGNLAFAISSAFLKAFAKSDGKEVYEYMSNDASKIPAPIGVFVNKTVFESDFKEFMLYPVQQKNFSNDMLKLVDVKNGFEIDKNMTTDKMLKKLSGLTTKNSLHLGIAFGANELWNGRKYVYSGTGENLSSQEQLLLIQDIVGNYPVGYVEDPFHGDDFVLFATLTHRLPTRLVSGNELYSNNIERFKNGADMKSTSCITINPSHISTITDIINLVREARKHMMTIVMDITGNNDALFSHLAVCMGVDYVKIGLGDKIVSNANELLRIEGKLAVA